ncbi:hypothetical protein N9K86_02195 [Litoricolaceae bacterium]|nr:hypothetical protein [Litorivicinaceae bacterium]
MAFNKGLQLVDANSVVRDSVALEVNSTAPAFFQSQLVDGAIKAHGATVFTIRPDTGAAGEYIEIVVGQNFAIGIEYNADGDQYRLVIQSRTAYDAGAGTTTPAYGSYVDAEVETTFGVNLSDNGTLTYMHTGSGAQTLSIPAITSATDKTASVELEDASSAGTDVVRILLDDGRGNAVIVDATSSGSPGDLTASLDTNFNALSAEQRSGFVLDDDGSNTLTVSRVDGAGFTISSAVESSVHVADMLRDKSAAAGVYVEDAAIDVSKVHFGDFDADGTDDSRGDFFDRDYDGFVSQFAEFNAPLTVSELSGYVNQPATIPETLVNSDGEDSTAIITFEQTVPDATASITYELTFDDTNGHAITIDYETGTSDTFATAASELKASFNALSDKAGFSFDDSVANQITISRADGADFKVSSGSNSDYDAADNLVVNGNELAAASGYTYTSSDIVAATIDLAQTADATVAAGTAGATYEIVLDDGAGNTETVSAFLTNAGIASNDALDALVTAFQNIPGVSGAGPWTTTSGFTMAAESGNVSTISRADGRNFTIKLGSNDEADNLGVGSDSLTTDSTIESTDGIRTGVLDTISNKVVQNFDFTTLSDADEVVGKATANYAGENTIDILGMSKAAGPHATTMVKLGTATTGFDEVSSSAYTGSAVVADGAAEASNVLYAQLRNVEDEGANREFTADIFIDPNLITDGDFGAISFQVAWDAALTIDGVSQLDATGGYKLDDVDVANDQAVLRWFKPTALTDFSAPIATLTYQDDSTGQTDPTFTFSQVDIDGVDFTDGTTYTAEFTSAKDATLWDQTDTLVNGNDGSTEVADQLVVVSAAPGGSATVPNPTSGLYLSLDAYDQDASADSPDVDYTLGVYSSTATNTVSFEVELPALADVSVDPDTLVNNTTFTLDPGLTDWNVTSVALEGRTLVVEASGVTNLAVGDSIGQVATTITNGFGTTQLFDLVNVQTDSDAANENGRGLYVAATRTDADGEWTVEDLPTGIMTRAYVGSAEIGSNAVTALDAYYALQISAGLVPNWHTGSSATQGQMIAADFDSSGKVTAADALAILEYSVGNVPTPDPVQWKFFDSETSGLTVTTVDDIAALAENLAISSSSSSSSPLGQGDEVVLVGDLSDPAA